MAKSGIVTPATDLDPDDAPPRTRVGSGSRTLKLQSGGTLTLTLDVNLLHAGQDERTLIFNLIDQFTAYERTTAEKP